MLPSENWTPSVITKKNFLARIVVQTASLPRISAMSASEIESSAVYKERIFVKESWRRISKRSR